MGELERVGGAGAKDAVFGGCRRPGEVCGEAAGKGFKHKQTPAVERGGSKDALGVMVVEFVMGRQTLRLASEHGHVIELD